jgi:hypothetical protein
LSFEAVFVLIDFKFEDAAALQDKILNFEAILALFL